MRITEKNVISELQKRNVESLEYIISKYSRDIYGLIYTIMNGIGGREDVEECVSDVFVCIWNKYENYSEERGNFKTWILIIAKYRALDYRRKLLVGNNNISTEEIELVSPDRIDNKIIDNEEKKNIILAINKLKEPDREIFYRRYFFYESIEKIAEHLGLTREAVDNRLCRGRKRIREVLSVYRKENAI